MTPGLADSFHHRTITNGRSQDKSRNPFAVFKTANGFLFRRGEVPRPTIEVVTDLCVRKNLRDLRYLHDKITLFRFIRAGYNRIYRVIAGQVHAAHYTIFAMPLLMVRKPKRRSTYEKIVIELDHVLPGRILRGCGGTAIYHTDR